MIGIGTGVDDVANRLGCDPFDRGDDRGSVCSRSRVHDHDAVFPHLDADIPSGTGDHEEVGPDVHDLETAGARGHGAWGLSRRRNFGPDSRTAIDEAERSAHGYCAGELKTTNPFSSWERHGSPAGKRSTWPWFGNPRGVR